MAQSYKQFIAFIADQFDDFLLFKLGLRMNPVHRHLSANVHSKMEFLLSS